jgi:hypothetical protein
VPPSNALNSYRTGPHKPNTMPNTQIRFKGGLLGLLGTVLKERRAALGSLGPILASVLKHRGSRHDTTSRPTRTAGVVPARSDPRVPMALAAGAQNRPRGRAWRPAGADRRRGGTWGRTDRRAGRVSRVLAPRAGVRGLNLYGLEPGKPHAPMKFQNHLICIGGR